MASLMHMLASFLRHAPCAFVGMLTLACGGAQVGADSGGDEEENRIRPASRATANELPAEPKRTVAESKEIRFLLRDLAVQNACKHVSGQFRGMAADGEDVIEGRMFIEECKTESRGDNELVLRTGARAWRWVDKKSKKLGATFQVNQYATMKVGLEVQGSVEIGYTRDAHIVNLWLVPSRPPKADVKPLRQIDAEPEGAWSELLGAVSGAVGQGPDRQATKKVGTVGRQQFQKQLSHGYSFAVELCTGQVHEKDGELPEGKAPQAPVPSAGRIWLENERVRLHPGGIDLSGPDKPTHSKLEVELQVEKGGPLRARLICKEDAARLAVAFSEGKKLPKVKALANELIPQGASKTLKADTHCEAVLYTAPGPKADMPITFKHIDYEPGNREEPLVPCPK